MGNSSDVGGYPSRLVRRVATSRQSPIATLKPEILSEVYDSGQYLSTDSRAFEDLQWLGGDLDDISNDRDQ
jgi:hypothetical protein